MNFNGTLRFEAILPNISFQVTQIRTIPILSTPLSIKLARRKNKNNRYNNDNNNNYDDRNNAYSGSSSYSNSNSNSNGNNNNLPQVGFVTLNQTRKIVPLLEHDHAVSLSPIVGVWTAFDFDIDESECDTSNSLQGHQNTHQNAHENKNKNGNQSRNENRSRSFDTNSSYGINEYSNSNSNLNTNSSSKPYNNFQDSPISHVKNPLTWAILVRFLYNENIKTRAFVEDETEKFLLVRKIILKCLIFYQILFLVTFSYLIFLIYFIQFYLTLSF